MNAPDKVGQLIAEQLVSAVSVPVVSRARFSELTGVPEGVVQGWISRGYLPTYSIGKYTLINLTLLNNLALQRAPWL
ncbi:MAG: hypothetical protein K2P67_07490 [Gallionellaceae bacterium]|jgi:hypothetical protein|nr:hypothetical protein [Gallionellaceae bacterium]